MDYYFLYIYDGISDKEESFLAKYINSVVPDNTFFENILNCSLLSSTTYLNKISLSSKLKKSIQWTKIDANNFTCNESLEINQEEDSVSCESSSVAKYLHDLTDQLPNCGTFTLDVVISEHVVENFNVNDHIEFAASLHRLTKWHNAHTIILSDEKNNNQSVFKKWTELTNAKLLKTNISFDSGPLVWRGAVELKHPKLPTQNCDNFELKFKSSIKIASTKSKLDNFSHKHLVLHPVLQAIDVCYFSSIPHHIIVPVPFTLCSSSSTLSSNSRNLLHFVNKEKEAALIVRLGYSILNEKPKLDKSLSTIKWHKMVLSGNMKYPDNCFPIVDNYISLVISKSSNSENMVVYILRNLSNLNAQFYFNAVNSWNMKCHNPPGKKVKNTDTKFEFEIPLISETNLHSHLSKIQETDEKFHDKKNELSHEDLNTLLTSFVDSITSSEYSSLHLSGNLVNVTSEEVDPTDWPERVYLLHKQIQIEEENKNIRNVFLNLSPQRPHYNVSLSGSDIKKYFLPSGEGKDVERAIPVQLINHCALNNYSNLDQILANTWPNILNCTYGDIYYNVNNQSEEKESLGNDMVRCFVQHETASTCNINQKSPDAPISIQADNLTPRKRHRSSKPQTSLRQAIMKPDAKKVKEKIFKTAEMQSNPVITTIMKTLGVKKSPQIDIATKLSHSRISRKNSQPVRRSPIKRTTVDYYSPSSKHSISRKTLFSQQASTSQKSLSSQSSSSSQQNKKSPADMPEILKKKLRAAVATALETNGISMNNSLFRPCFKKLFTICHTFIDDLPRKGSTNQYMQKIADAHVKQVIKFEKQKNTEK